MPLNLRTAVPCTAGCGRGTNSRLNPPYCRHCQLAGRHRRKKGLAKTRGRRRRVEILLPEWGADWVAHLDRLGERVKEKKPLFGDE